VLDLGARPDDERRANDAGHLLAVHHLFAERAVAGHDLLLGVAQEVKGQTVLLAKGGVFHCTVGRHADDLHAEFSKGRQSVVELTGLFGATGGVVGGIEVNDESLT
jgi:hypothetical protein